MKNSMKRKLPNILGIITVVLLVVMLFQLNTISNRIGTMTGDVVAEYENTYDLDGSPVLGDLDKAKVIILEFSDFECPYCNAGHSVMNELYDTYGDDIAIVFKHFPLSFHEHAQKASEASMCANDQDMFWEYHDELFENQASFSDSYFVTLAEELDLDMDDFNDCLDSGKYYDKVQEDFNYGVENGITGTPGFIVNGELVKGAQPASTFATYIDGWL
jgi:protein-disulfide isomerase